MLVFEGTCFGRFIGLSNARRMIELDTKAAYQKKLVSNTCFLYFFFSFTEYKELRTKKGKESVVFNGLRQLRSSCPP